MKSIDLTNIIQFSVYIPTCVPGGGSHIYIHCTHLCARGGSRLWNSLTALQTPRNSSHICLYPPVCQGWIQYLSVPTCVPGVDPDCGIPWQPYRPLGAAPISVYTHLCARGGSRLWNSLTALQTPRSSSHICLYLPVCQGWIQYLYTLYLPVCQGWIQYLYTLYLPVCQGWIPYLYTLYLPVCQGWISTVEFLDSLTDP